MKMTDEDKQLLITEICYRLPYGVKFSARGGKLIHTAAQINVETGIISTATILSISVERVKIYLRSLSTMTEEEKLLFYQNTLTFNEKTGHSELTIKSVDWLNKHHFDYRGLIQKGLAEEMPVDMYE